MTEEEQKLVAEMTHVAFPVEKIRALADFLAQKQWHEVSGAMEIFKTGQLCKINPPPHDHTS